MMFLQCITVGLFQENCYLIGDPASGLGAIIDPGDEADRILSAVNESKLKYLYILNTHAHLDHVGAVDAIKKELNIPFYLHREEEAVLKSVPMQAAMFGLPPLRAPHVDVWYDINSTIELGSLSIRLLFTPGHTPGGVSLCMASEKTVIAGDTLFNGSIGRTDLPGGNFDTLISSIHNKLFVLPDDTLVYPGHGPETTIGYEKQYNPFCATHRGGYFA